MTSKAINLLRGMIATPSISREEDAVCDLIAADLGGRGIETVRFGRNLVAGLKELDPAKPTLMLNSHMDTVKPATSYTRDPFDAEIVDGVLYGLGSNDAGASVVSLIEVYDRLHNTPLPYNMLLCISAEEEVGGENGMRLLLPALAEAGVKIDAALVGEPTEMQPAIAERGLLVLDCVTKGKVGHAARNEGINAIYRAIADIDALRNFEFDRHSSVLGPVKVTVTQIEAGRQHNVIPEECKWVVDVRTTDIYNNQETTALLQGVMSEHTVATPRSFRMQASVIDESHPLVEAAVKLGRVPFISPTTSDMAHMWTIPSLKIGPGHSSRSHSADEYILISEIEEAIDIYTRMLSSLTL